MHDEITKQLQLDEGLRLKPYQDSRGIETIGYGRNLRDKGLTEKECLWLLWNDIDEVQAFIRTQWTWTLHLDDARLGVLVNMGFQLGIAGLAQFRQMLAAMQSSQWESAAEHLEDSDYYRQVPARAERMKQQLLTGVWQYAK